MALTVYGRATYMVHCGVATVFSVVPHWATATQQPAISSLCTSVLDLWDKSKLWNNIVQIDFVIFEKKKIKMYNREQIPT